MKILERWQLVAGEGRLREETNGNVSLGRSRFFKDLSTIGYKVALGQVFLRVLRFSPVSIIPSGLHTHVSGGKTIGLWWSQFRDIVSPRKIITNKKDSNGEAAGLMKIYLALP
jgi:hypothetical protein